MYEAYSGQYTAQDLNYADATTHERYALLSLREISARMNGHLPCGTKVLSPPGRLHHGWEEGRDPATDAEQWFTSSTMEHIQSTQQQ